MEEAAVKQRSRKKTISINGFMVPSMVLLTILQALVIFFIVGINSESSALFALTQQSSFNVNDATSVLAGSSLLSETCSTFVLRPIDEKGVFNQGPLIAYAEELKVDRRGDAVVARLKQNSTNQSAIDRLQEAANAANIMMNHQFHAIALVTDVYPMPLVPVLSTIPLPELSAEEKALGKDEKLAKAVDLVLNTAYSRQKSLVSTKVNNCVSLLQDASAEEATKTNAKIKAFRWGLWVSSLCSILALGTIFLTLYFGLHKPLVDSTHRIQEDQKLNGDKGFTEVRLLATSYNGLIEGRDCLEEQLKAAAEKDPLTGLGSRYSFDETVKRLLSNETDERSIAYLIFDLNFLKRTNDNEGHAAGDALLIRASRCIHECFKDQEDNNCFRLGGDEFAALLVGENEQAIQDTIEVFRRKQNDFTVSIAWGYAYCPSIGKANLKILMKEADEQMYECKASMHQKNH